MPADARALESLLAFWASAGVADAVADAPADWTAPPARSERGAAPAPPSSTPGPGRGPAPRAAPARPAAEASGLAIEAAKAAAAATGTLDDLAAAIAAFEGCPLSAQGASLSVFMRGAADAPILAVGEAPGAEEDRQGLPFVGRAGRLLDAMLGAAGLEGRVLITNTVYWRPPGNRDPLPAEQAICAPFLERTIEILRPRLILVLGASAARAMLDGARGIMAIRGQWFSWRSADGAFEAPLLPTLHPAFLLRSPAAKRFAWTDMLALAQRLESLETSG